MRECVDIGPSPPSSPVVMLRRCFKLSLLLGVSVLGEISILTSSVDGATRGSFSFVATSLKEACNKKGEGQSGETSERVEEGQG
jgi:hypothetical protein